VTCEPRTRRGQGGRGWPGGILLCLFAALILVPTISRGQQALSCGQPVSASLATGTTDSYRFTAPAGTAVVVQASSLSPELGLLRMRALGAGVDEETCSNVLEFVARGGTVSISVSPCFGGSGSYTLTLQVVSGGSANCGVPLHCGLTPLGTGLSVPGEVDSFRFDSAGGSQVRIRFSDGAGLESAYSLRIYDSAGTSILDGRCADLTTVTVPATGTYTALVGSCVGLRTSEYRIQRYDAQCPRGPEITYLGLLPQNQDIVISNEVDEEGRPVYFGQRGTLVIEARPGESGATVGGSAYTPFAPPDAQLIVDRDLGNGSVAICDVDPPGGVPASRPFVFGQDAAAIGRMNDLGCRVDDGVGNPIGHRVPLDACPRNINGSPSFVSDDTTIEFCLPISLALAFPEGDTIVKARVRDQRQNLGAEREIVVRVATTPPSPTPTPTRTATATRTATWTATRTATRARTPTIRPPGPCTCDCNENGRVSVAELTRATRIALGELNIPACRLADGNDDGTVDVADLVMGTRNALDGCPPAPLD